MNIDGDRHNNGGKDSIMNEIITTQTAVTSLPDQNATLTEMYLRFINKDKTSKNDTIQEGVSLNTEKEQKKGKGCC